MHSFATVGDNDRYPGWISALCGAIAIALATLATAYVYPCSASAVVDGPREVAAGVPAVFDAAESVGHEFTWTAPEGCASTVLDAGRRIVLVAPKGSHRLSLTVRSASWGRLSTSSTTFDFSAGADPGPDPVPPGPTPPPTPDKRGLAKWAREQAMALVSSPGRTSEAKAIAEALRGVVAEIAAGTVSTPAEAGSRADSTIDQRLGDAAPAWEQFRWAFLSKARAIYGISPKLADVAECFAAVANGLESL